MPRAVLIFLGLAALGVAGAWLTDHPGLVSLQWGGRQIETSTAFAATAFASASVSPTVAISGSVNTTAGMPRTSKAVARPAITSAATSPSLDPLCASMGSPATSPTA